MRFFLQALADDVVGGAALEDPLPAGVVGKFVALEEALQGIVGAMISTSCPTCGR